MFIGALCGVSTEVDTLCAYVVRINLCSLAVLCTSSAQQVQ